MSAANTPAQERAINQGGNVLVVAGAGTGKTRTLVQRCVRLLLTKPCGLDRILMVTFTEAAAAEMRKRIRDELRARQRTEAAPACAEHIRHQLLLLDAACIGTLHSFCLQLVRRHTSPLAIDPAVQVLDEHQTAPLITEVLGTLFQRHYLDPASAEVRSLIRQFGSGSDAAIRRLVLQIHHHSQSLPNPADWLATQERIYAQSTPSAWRGWFEEAFAEWRRQVAPELRAHEHAPDMKRFLTAEREEALDALRALCEDEKLSKELKRFKRFWSDANLLCSVFRPTAGTDILAEEWKAARPHMRALLGLAREFNHDYAAAKRRIGGVDFADLEQMALALLRTPSGQPTAVAQQWRERFEFIFVDECQDINRAQDAILQAISRGGGEANRFLVGDVKQSIFRFRRADPSIFLEYDLAWGQNDGGERVALSDNFRSREGIVRFVNTLFAGLMRPAIGGLSYGTDAHLQFGNPAQRRHLLAADLEPRVELHLIERGEPEEAADEGEDGNPVPLDLTSTEREARLAAKLLGELQARQHPVWDEDVERMRPVEWKDMAVLLRSAAGKAEAYAKEFNAAGIPLVAARSGLLEALEISDLLNLLRILDNPVQDVPLLAVLRSPLAAFSLEELVALRLRLPKGRLWHALRAFHDTARTHPAWIKIEHFLNRYRRWRAAARQGSVCDCLHVVLAETHYESMLLAEERGEERVANVHRFLELARHHDPFQRVGLYRFLKFIAAQQAEELEHEPASAQSANAVRLMTIHKSKGLEFPVVLLGGLASPFNRRDLYGDVLLQDRYGLCPRIWPPGAVQNYSGLAHWLGKQAEERELLGEEMRLLYVAMTRARDTLLLTGMGRNQIRWESQPGRTLTDLEVVSAASYLGWLNKWLASVTAPGDWTTENEGRHTLLKWRIWPANDPLLNGVTPAKVTAHPVGIRENTVTERLRPRLTWRYTHRAATEEPAVKRVSEVIWSAESSGEEEQLVFDHMAAPRPLLAPSRRRSRVLSAAEVGHAHHIFLQTMPLEPGLNAERLEAHARLLVTNRSLSQDEAAALDLGAIEAFWISGVGQKILACGKAVHREVPFTARFSPQDLAGLEAGGNASDLEGEFFVTRGVVDLAVVLPRELWLVDFKTDRLEAHQLAGKVQIYGRQLKLYGLALGRIYGRPVTFRWLHFLNAGATVEV